MFHVLPFPSVYKAMTHQSHSPSVDSVYRTYFNCYWECASGADTGLGCVGRLCCRKGVKSTFKKTRQGGGGREEGKPRASCPVHKWGLAEQRSEVLLLVTWPPYAVPYWPIHYESMALTVTDCCCCCVAACFVLADSILMSPSMLIRLTSL